MDNKKVEVSIIITTYNRKDDIVKCVDSVLLSTFQNMEIIVVDNASSDGTCEILEERFGDRINIVRSEQNLMAGGGRNLGAAHAIGTYLLFIDSDNIIDKNMVNELVQGYKSKKDCGLVGPIMYFYSHPDVIWWAGSDINHWTSKTTYPALNTRDSSEYTKITEVGHVPNVFIIKKYIWEEVGGIDSHFHMHYEESDLAGKVKKVGYKNYMVPSAVTYHNMVFDYKDLRTFALNSPVKIYYVGRNRILYMKRNCNLLQYAFFILLPLHIFNMYYLWLIIRSGRYSYVKNYLHGVIDGIIGK